MGKGYVSFSSYPYANGGKGGRIRYALSSLTPLTRESVTKHAESRGATPIEQLKIGKKPGSNGLYTAQWVCGAHL